MFIGHYGPASAVAGERIKLWHGFIAVQFLDILWAPFVLANIEHVRIVENFTASNHLDLYHMPYTHSLPMALVWSITAAIAYRLLCRRAGVKGAMIIGALVFSHWILDLITHKPDLELWFGGPKAGLALWDNRPLALGVELGLFAIGFTVYLSRMRAKNALGAVAVWLTVILAAAGQFFGNYGPPPDQSSVAAMSGILAYGVFAALAGWIDATHVKK